MKKILKVIPIVVMLCLYIGCDSKPSKNGIIEYGMPQDVGISDVQLEKAVNLYKIAVQQNRITGVQLLVARHGKVVVHEGLGFRDLENHLHMEKNTHIRMASITKTVVASSVLKLAEEGLLNLEDHISKHIHGFDKGLSKRIQIKHLLTHTAGFEYTYYNFVDDEITYSANEFYDAPSLSMEAYKIGLKGPRDEPGIKSVYSNFAYTVLGALIEIVSGQKLDVYLQQQFYDPLGMKDTSHKIYGIDPSKLSINYQKINGEWEIFPPETPPFARSTGGLITTSWDFAKFCQMYLNEGTYGTLQILSPESVKKAISPMIESPYQYMYPDVMVRNNVIPNWYCTRDKRDLGLDLARGLVWVVSVDGSFSHAGFRGTFAYVNPELDLVILIFAQSRVGGNPGQEFIEAVEASVAK
jgi:CubicO group peptidase (beta-lactamase class C family)